MANDQTEADSDDAQRRNSRALIPSLISDPIDRARAEAANGLLQYDQGIAIAQSALDIFASGNVWKLRPSAVLSLQRRALQGISSFAGNYRPGPVEIEGSNHNPPAAHLVPELVEDLCDYVNDNWRDKTAIHLSAYIMWRLNWIHPFDDGNGRTSRVVSYVILLAKTNNILAGSPTIPELITKHRKNYFDAIDDADEKFKRGLIDVSRAEDFISSMLAKQLTTIYDFAGGTLPQDPPG